jgi:hypothetical protein
MNKGRKDMNINLLFTWILFLGLFPISFFWFKRAWRIIIKKDYTFVALKRGKPPENPKKFALLSSALNFIPALIFTGVIFLIIFSGLSYEQWTAIVGTTFWMKLFAEFILSRHAHKVTKEPNV